MDFLYLFLPLTIIISPRLFRLDPLHFSPMILTVDRVAGPREQPPFG